MLFLSGHGLRDEDDYYYIPTPRRGSPQGGVQYRQR